MSPRPAGHVLGDIGTPNAAGSILVLLPSWIGDTVMAEPALRALRAASPGARIVTLGRPGLDAVLAGTGLVERAVSHDLRGPLGPWRAARMMHSASPPFDAIVLLPNSFRSALAARLIPARRRIGYATDGRAVFLTDAIAAPHAGSRLPVPAVEWYATLVERGFKLAPLDDAARRPRLRPSDAQSAEASTLLAGVDAPYALLNPGANRADKRWPAERFAAVGRALGARGLAVVVNGGPQEAELARSVAAACGGVDLAARGVTLGGLLGVVAGAAIVVSNDTGPRHLALGLGVPTVSLFGPTDHRWTTIPGAIEARLLGEPFLTEEEVADRRPKACRVERIEVGDVLAAIAYLEARTSPRSAADPRSREGRPDEPRTQ